jgi:filamentous hemagglutinin
VGKRVGNQWLVPIGQSTSKTNIIKNSPQGKILAGRNMSVLSNNIVNDASHFLAGQNLVSTGRVDNIMIGSTNEIVNHYAIVRISSGEYRDGFIGRIVIEDIYTETNAEQLPSSTSAIFGGGKQVTIQGNNVNNVTLTPGKVINTSNPISTTGHHNSATSQISNNNPIVTDISTSVSSSGVEANIGSGVSSSGQAGNATVKQAGSNTPTSTGINTSLSSGSVAVNTGSGVTSSYQVGNAAVSQANSNIPVASGINTSVSSSGVAVYTGSDVKTSGQTGNAAVSQSDSNTPNAAGINTSISSGNIAVNNSSAVTASGQGGSAAVNQAGSNIPVAAGISTNVSSGGVAVNTNNGVASLGQNDSAVVNQSNTTTYASKINTTMTASGIPAGNIQTLLPSAQTGPVTPPQTNNGGTITVPANGMYAVHTEPTAHYLVETNPRFTAYNNFISSDYMLKKLNIDPGATMKRLGDGFYEQKLVREQITDLTGRVFLPSYDNAEAQYKALLENGAVIAKAFNLQVGIALTAEQMSQLTSSIVWMVEKEVNGQKVLTPVVYLPQLREGDLKANGAVIAADNVIINASGMVNNAGAIKANSQAQISAATVNNLGGSIDGGSLTHIAAGDDLFNLSGTISGDKVNLFAGKDFKSETVTFTMENSLHTATTSGNVASIDAGQKLTINAGQDLSLLGTQLSAGTDLSLVAGRNLEAASVVDQERWGSGSFITNQITNLQTSLKAGSNLNLLGTDMNLQGVRVKAGEDINLSALGNVNITSVQDQTSATNQYYFDFNNQAATINKVSLFEAGSDLTFKVSKDLNLIGVQAAAGDNLSLAVGGNILLSAVKDSAFSDVKVGDNKNYKRVMTNDETVIGTNLSANNNLFVNTLGSLAMEGSSVISKHGNIGIVADQGIKIQEVTETHEALTETKKTKRGFLSKKTTETRDYSLVNEVIGSTISGETVDMTAGTDLTVKAGNIVGTNDVSLTAGRDINITSVAETGAAEHYSYTKKSGLFSGGGLGFTIGSQSTKTTTNVQAIGEIGSTIGSINGDVSIKAGEKVNSSGTTIVSGKDVNITGKDVTIDNTIDTYDSQTKFEFKQSGLSVSLKGGMVDTAMSANDSIQRAGDVQDERLKALYDYKAFKDLQKIDEQLSKGVSKENLKQGVSVSVSIGSSKITSEQSVHMETVNATNINAGGDVTIKATEGDLKLKGTNIKAEDITLEAVKNITIDAAQNKQLMDSKTNSSSWSFGANLGTNTSYFGNFSKGSGKEKENATINSGSVIDASGTLALNSGADTSINGSQVKGEKVVAAIGGDLNINSLQDTDDYTAKNKNSGSGFTTGAKGGVTGSFGTGKTNSTYASVTEQAGIYAGKDGFDIQVGKNTDLKGAVIASDATSDKNILSTDTLTYWDIQNKAEYSASNSGFSFDTKGKIPVTPTPGMPVSGDADSTTKSAVATGTIEIRSNPNQDLSTLSRDTTGALNALNKIFDKKTVQEKQELANLFGEVAFNAIGDLALSQYKKAKDKRDDATTAEEKAYYQNQMNQWDEGGSNKILLHALAGGIMSDLGGNGFASGVVSAGVNEAIQKGLSNIKDPGLHQLASALVGGVAAKIVGGNASVGASVAASATKNNILSHKEAKEMEDELSKCKTDEERAAVLEKWDKISKDRDAVIKQWSIEFDNAKTDEEREAIFEKIRKQYEIWGISDVGEIFVLENRNTDISVDLDSRYEGLSKEKKEILYKVDNAETPGEKLKYSAQFFGQGLAEQFTTYRDSQYNLALNTGLSPELAAIAADYATWNLIGPALSTVLRTGNVAGSGLGNLLSKGSSKVVSNMGEFFQKGFGDSIKNNLSKTTLQYDGQSIYKVTSKTSNEYLKKGYGVYLDALHKDHLEVINKSGKVIYVLNLDGTLNADKTAKAIGRVINGW